MGTSGGRHALLPPGYEHAAPAAWLPLPPPPRPLLQPTVLQGFGHVHVNATLASCAALVELAGSAGVLLALGGRGSGAAGLLALGLVSWACQALLAVASLVAVARLPPAEAQGCVVIGAREVLGLRSADPSPAAAPLLAGAGEPVQERPRLLDAATRKFLRRVAGRVAWRSVPLTARLRRKPLVSPCLPCAPLCAGTARRCSCAP